MSEQHMALEGQTLEHFSVDLPKERARRQYEQYGEREATQGKSLKNALLLGMDRATSIEPGMRCPICAARMPSRPARCMGLFQCCGGCAQNIQRSIARASSTPKAKPSG